MGPVALLATTPASISWSDLVGVLMEVLGFYVDTAWWVSSNAAIGVVVHLGIFDHGSLGCRTWMAATFGWLGRHSSLSPRARVVSKGPAAFVGGAAVSVPVEPTVHVEQKLLVIRVVRTPVMLTGNAQAAWVGLREPIVMNASRLELGFLAMVALTSLVQAATHPTGWG